MIDAAPILSFITAGLYCIDMRRRDLIKKQAFILFGQGA